MKLSREFAWPTPHTFDMPPVRQLLGRICQGKCVCDPFCGKSRIGHLRNDVNPEHDVENQYDAPEFLERLLVLGARCDVLLLEHPCPRRLQHLQWLVGKWVDGVVLDPFCGSGTTLLAAKQGQRQAIGIEIEERYAEIAARRLEQEVFTFPEAPNAAPEWKQEMMG